MGTSSDISELDPIYRGSGLKIGIVMSRFNKDICEGLLSACETELDRLGVARDDVLLVDVPGALEHPLALQKMAQSGKYDALIAIGAVVRGDTYHFHVPSNAPSRATLPMHLHTGVPIATAPPPAHTADQRHVRMQETC